MSDAGVVLDAGAFIALERRDPLMVRLTKRFADAGTPLVTSAAACVCEEAAFPDSSDEILDADHRSVVSVPASLITRWRVASAKCESSWACVLVPAPARF